MREVVLRIRGRVTGVSYRAFVRDAALRHGIRGYVRNEGDDVEVVAQGEDLEGFLIEARQGPSWARVERIETEERDAEPKEGFVIRRDAQPF